jgi:hypothetical protein
VIRELVVEESTAAHTEQIAALETWTTNRYEDVVSLRARTDLSRESERAAEDLLTFAAGRGAGAATLLRLRSRLLARQPAPHPGIDIVNRALDALAGRGLTHPNARDRRSDAPASEAVSEPVPIASDPPRELRGVAERRGRATLA